MDCIGARRPRRVDDRLAIEIRAREPDRFVGVGDEGRVPVGIDVDGDAADPHVVGAADDAAGDLTPVCNEKRLQAHRRNTP